MIASVAGLAPANEAAQEIRAMTRTFRMALTAALLAGPVAPIWATQSAPMGAPSDMAPPAPLLTTSVTDTTPARDASVPKLIKARHTSHRRIAAHRTGSETVAAGTGQVKS